MKIGEMGRNNNINQTSGVIPMEGNPAVKMPVLSLDPGITVNKDFWQDRNVLITGCSGLLGSWMTETLVESRANVVGLIRDWVPRSKLITDGTIDKMHIVRGQLEDYYTIERTLGQYKIDTIFHLGAQTIVGVANNHPMSTFEANIKGTWNILEAARHSPLVKRVIVASSDKAYGEQKELPYRETAPLQGQHPYDVSKSCADLLSQMYFKTYELPVCITRCGNFYGGGDLNFNRIVPGTIRSALDNKAPVIRSDGKYIRDYFYIENGVGAYLLLAERMEELKISGEAFNFSNENQVTVLDLVNKILEVMGSSLKPVILNEAKNEILSQHLSAEKARKILDWKPKFNLDESLKKTVAWYRTFFNNK